MPPAKLYKYQPFSEYAIENLALGRVFFSRPSDFNDPFEFRVRFERVELTPDLRCDLAAKAKVDAEKLGFVFDEAALESFVSGVVNVHETAHRDLQNLGVACFSELHDHPLMWAHYAAGHTGFCLEFSTDCALFSKAIQVEYLSSAPIVDHAAFALVEDPVRRLRTLAASKLDAWAYEKEWRCFHAERTMLYGYEARDLTGVYFGLRMTEGHKIAIGSLLQKTPTKLFRMIECEESYGVRAEAVDFSQPNYTESA